MEDYIGRKYGQSWNQHCNLYLTEAVQTEYMDDSNLNPTAGVSDHYSLYDWFHRM